MSFEPEYITTQTDGIEISACQALLDNTSCAYYLRIENNTFEKIQLLGKDFCITDEQGNNFYNTEIGFKGELPELNPGEYFEYAAEAPLSLKHGVLYGSCRIVREKSKAIQEVKIPTVTIETGEKTKKIYN